MPVLSVGEEFPHYELTAVVPGVLAELQANSEHDYFTTVSSRNLQCRWRLIFMWPRDFSFVCPTEVRAFADIYEELQEMGCDVVGINTDNEYCHFAWRATQKMLLDVPFPLASDLTREVLGAAGVINAEGVCNRATFLVDPQNVIQHVAIDNPNVGRSTTEILRQLRALQAGGLTCCNWEPGGEMIDAFKGMSLLSVPECKY